MSRPNHATRRAFLASSAVAAAGLPLVAAVPAHAVPGRRPDAKKLLMLGGTGFLGPAIVESALRRGHEVTLFNRGKTNPHLFPDLEKIRDDPRHLALADDRTAEGSTVARRPHRRARARAAGRLAHPLTRDFAPERLTPTATGP